MANEDVDKLSMAQRWTFEVAGMGKIPGHSVSGGEPQRDEVDGTTGDSLQSEATSGQESVGEVTVTSYVLPNNKVWREIYTKTFVNKAKDHRFDATLRLLDEGGNIIQETHWFECTMTNYDFPEVRAGSGELLLETCGFKPQRTEVKGK